MSEKKRKMIDVDPAVVEMFARVLQKLKPPPKLTISEWADWFRQMSPEASAGTGRWHTDNAPYQREIMDAIGNPHVRMVVFKSSSQVGKTEVLLNVLGYYIDYNPAPILVLQPTVEMGQTFSKDRLAPMIRDTAVLRKKMDAKSRFSGNTIMQKTFPGGHVTIVGANSPAGLASRPIKIVLADEVDRYPVSAGTEGDPLNLAQTRQTTFWDKKTVLVSTPTIKGSSRIEKSWLESTMEEWTVPCPECGEYQPMVWANVVFDRERWPKGGVQYRCESCGCIAGEYRWKAQGRKGRYAALHPEREVRGFHLNVLASSFCAWAGIVTEFLSAKEALDHGNPELMKVWVNTKLGETWEERGETADDMALLARREMYTATVPAQVLVLTCGIDVQDDRFELELVGWGVGKESWGIRYQKIYGDPLKPQIWEDLDKFLQTRWRREDGVVLDILAETAGEEPIHVEFQISDDDDHMRRVRYCNGSIDTHLLKKGGAYKELPDVYHIYITMNDFIGGGRTVYEIFRTVRDREGTYSTQYPVENGVHELYINLEIPLDDGSELDHLLRYIKETTEENEDACFGHIIKSVKECREGEDEIMKYYSSHEFFEEGKNKRKVFGL